ncbi:phosphonopyruvate decarboxylase [Candidatus Lucifugimonas marina]|uniref:Phosphonopyruvate decarboxylase n=1 Tax=Candidatus Lucifugimonas marina TaxID=3038979 RepID=A0AAJ5ZGE5_9CHLR|nr:phosphonopyruvate decarboxylase [SAR202 cluster bacterium JH702]MDG0868270.1 phosphonopyruvate decarboxylase [SAR202 cluster bacterium JH639]WFG34914.1 phosphonopyruvate decarboxylase [SAR202 cluster bacterium JH545]WFG38865.1 phosphonopyruvate decarboxylase [SAR202 cluster bacterium JH1073]
MISPENFCAALAKHDIDFFAGVPDSILKDLSGYITTNFPPENHVIAANEGNAVALASGHYLATSKPAAVYMQNSGIGNAINPLLSLADQLVYSIPMLLIIGWRGEPGKKKDEPQHAKQGAVTLPLLEAMGIEYVLLDDSIQEISSTIDNLVLIMKESSATVALVVSAGTFEKYPYTQPNKQHLPMSREQAINAIAELLSSDDLIVSTTGMASRELFECRERLGQGHASDFLTVGSMGHASQIALSVAAQTPDRRVICIDGDGAALMHLGAMAISGTSQQSNFIHLVINNGAHDSVGGQPTSAQKIDLPSVALACGYASVISVETLEDLTKSLRNLEKLSGPTFIEINVRSGARSDLGRPTTSPIENRDAFMKNIRNGS